ncbi:UNVERIFIED_ORG: hypothetical protein ABIB63_000610 [Xanthomonas axonopodis]
MSPSLVWSARPIEIGARRGSPVRHVAVVGGHHFAEHGAEQGGHAAFDAGAFFRVHRLLELDPVAPVFPAGLHLVVAAPQHDAGVVAQPLDLFDRLLPGVLAELHVVRRYRAAEHEVLPDHDAQFVGDLVKIVVLVMPAAPHAQHVHVGIARILQGAAHALVRDTCREGIQRNQVGPLGEDRDAVDHDLHALAELVFFAAQLHRAQADDALDLLAVAIGIAHVGHEGVAVLRAVTGRKPALGMGDAHRQVDAVPAGIDHRVLGELADFLPVRAQYIQRHLHRPAAAGLQVQLRLQLRAIGIHALLGDMQPVHPHGVPRFHAHILPDAGVDHARAPIPAKVVRRLAHIGRAVACFGLVPERRIVGTRQRIRLLGQPRLDLLDRRIQLDLQHVVAALEQGLRVHAPLPEHVVGAEQLLAIEGDLGKRVQAVEHQLDMFALERGRIHVEAGLVLPIA